MTLLYIDGFDMNDWPLRLGGAGAGVSTSAAGTRFGVGRYLTSTSSSVPKALPVAVNRMIVGLAFYQTVGASTIDAFSVMGDSGVTTHTAIRVMANGALAVYRGATQTAISAAGIFPFNVWTYLEFSATVSDTVGVVKIRLNGVEVVSFTGDTRNGGTLQTLDTLWLLQPSGLPRWDDLYICDDTGPAPYNDFLGDVRVVTLSPTGPGNSTGLTPSATPNWGCVDEQPYSATDFVSSATVGLKDTYACADLPAGVSTVYAVQSCAVAKKSDAGARSLKTVVRSGGTDYPGTAQVMAASDASHRDLRTVDPNGNVAWTSAAVNAMEIGVEVA